MDTMQPVFAGVVDFVAGYIDVLSCLRGDGRWQIVNSLYTEL